MAKNKIKTILNLFEVYAIPSFQISLALIITISLGQPILDKLLVSGKPLNFLNQPLVASLAFIVLFIFTCSIGYLSYKLQEDKATNYFNLTITILFFYVLIIEVTTYTLLPYWSFIKFLYFLILIPISSLIFKYLKETASNYDISLDNNAKVNWGFLISDASIKQLSKDTGQSIQEIDQSSINSQPISDRIFNTLLNIKPSKAFTIGINGQWGSGKSSIIDLLEDKIITEKKKHALEIELIKINTWLFPDQQSLIKNFFNQIREHIPDLQLHLVLDEYLARIGEIEFQGITFNLRSLLFNSSSYLKLKSIIEKHLLESNKLLVVVLDDIDRLKKDEILEVASLVRAIADFPNIVYILCYDRNYIDGILDETLSYSNRPKYFDKIINLEINIPKLTSEDIGKYLVLALNKSFSKKYGNENNLDKYDKFVTTAYQYETNYYDYFLPTIRDAKRFINAFVLLHDLLGKKINIQVLFYLELLFYKHKDSLQLVSQNLYAFNKNIPIGDDTILKILFPNSEDQNSLDIIKSTIKNAFVQENIFERKTNLKVYFHHYGLYDYDNEDLKQFLQISNDETRMQELRSIVNKKLLHKFLYQFTAHLKSLSNGLNLRDFLSSLHSINDVLKQIDLKEHFVTIEPYSIQIIDAAILNQFAYANLTILISLEFTSSYIYRDRDKIGKKFRTALISDSDTKYLGSSITGVAIETTSPSAIIVNPPIQYTYTKRFNPALSQSNWISRVSHLYELNDVECSGKHTFIFELQFISPCEGIYLNSVELYVIADSDMNIKINEALINTTKISLYTEPEEKTPITITDHIVYGVNKLKFEITNNRSLNNKLDYFHNTEINSKSFENYKDWASNNPYAFIFSLLFNGGA